MEKLEGVLESTRKIVCPYCETSEYEDETGQFEHFDFLKLENEDGTLQSWRCRNCGQEFYIRLD